MYLVPIDIRHNQIVHKIYASFFKTKKKQIGFEEVPICVFFTTLDIKNPIELESKKKQVKMSIVQTELCLLDKPANLILKKTIIRALLPPGSRNKDGATPTWVGSI